MRFNRNHPTWRSGWQRRLTALVAAYAIALSGMVASLVGAQAAVPSAPAALILCHDEGTGQPEPASGHDGILCDNCCTGCLMLMAALPPAPTAVVAVQRVTRQVVHDITVAAPRAAPDTTSHRSRAPPKPV